MDALNLKSNLRRGLLILFFTNPDNKYYVRQLGGMLGFPAGNISRELKRLNRDHLFNTEQIGTTLLYQLNQNHPIYSELKSIIAKTFGVEGGLRTAIQGVNGITCAFIFGSFAKGEEYRLSDIDLFIIGQPDLDRLREAIHGQESILQREINYHTYSKSDWTGKVARKDSFILNLRKQPKIFLIGSDQCL